MQIARSRRPKNMQTSMSPAKAGRTSPARQRLRIEPLEDRRLLAIDSWTGGSGNWSDSSHWSAGHVPATGDDVQIDVAGITVTHGSGTDTINTVALASTA